MNRKFLVLTIVPLVLLGVLLVRNKPTTGKKTLGQETQNASSVDSSTSFTYKGQNIDASWHEVDTSKLTLLPNYTSKDISSDVMSANKCSFLSNAGFYDTDSNPIGLVVAAGKTISNWQVNDLFNGVLSVNELLTPRITTSLPRDPLNIAVQAGPILKDNAEFQTLKILSDSNDRRLVAAVTGENKLYFIIFYDNETNYSGPLLSDLPQVLKTFESKTGITFADAINLDGGSASVFKDNNTTLEEITPVGAFFCQL